MLGMEHELTSHGDFSIPDHAIKVSCSMTEAHSSHRHAGVSFAQYINIEEDIVYKVVDYKGVSRALAARDLGITRVPVIKVVVVF